MVEKRKLNKDEKNLITKQLVRLKTDLEHNDFLQRHNNLMINEGLWWNYQAKLKEYKQMRSELNSEKEHISNQISVLTKQMKEGVDVKDENAPSGVG